MSGVECRSRLERLEALLRQTQHEIAAARQRGVGSQLGRLLKLEGRTLTALLEERRSASNPPPVVLPTTASPDRATQLLMQLGVTSNEVKRWAIDRGLLDAVKRGRIRGDLVEAYAVAHTTT